MMKKTLVLLSSVLAGALLVGGAFAAYSIVDNAEKIGITTTPGTLTPEGTLTLDWGEHEQAIVDGSRLDGLLPGQPQKAGVLVLQAEYDENTQLTYYDGTLAVNFIDANEQERADKFIDFLNVKVYEGAIDEIGEAEPAAQALLGKAANLKLRGTKAGIPYTVFVELDATAASILDNIQEDEAQITFDWGKYVEPAPISTSRLVIAPEGDWTKQYNVPLFDNPAEEGEEVMAEDVDLVVGDLIYVVFNGETYLHFDELEANANFEDSEGNLKVKVAGAYDFYVTSEKIYAKNPDSGDDPAPQLEKGYYIVGSLTGDEELDWKVENGILMDAGSGDNLAVKEGVILKAGDAIKIVDTNPDIAQWYSIAPQIESYAFCDYDTDGNISFSAAGTYNFYFNNAHEIYIVQAQ